MTTPSSSSPRTPDRARPSPRWAPDPWDPSQLRYWDGEQWTGWTAERPSLRPPVNWGARARRLAVAGLVAVVVLSMAAGTTSGGWAPTAVDAHSCPTAWSYNAISGVLWFLAALVLLLGAAAFGRERRRRGTTDGAAATCLVLGTLAALLVPPFLFVMGFNACWA
jgi:hypothetical protein